MHTITAVFAHGRAAERAIEYLHDAGFGERPAADTAAATGESAVAPTAEFHVSPEPAVSPGAEASGPRAVQGAAIGGAIGFIAGLGAATLVGPAGPLAGAGVGAYSGSLIGALSGLPPADEADPIDRIDGRDGTSIVVVVATSNASRDKAVDILHAQGAVRIVESA